MLIVFGQLAFDNALAVLHTFPKLFPHPPVLPSPILLIRALLAPASAYDEGTLRGLQEAVVRLRKKSRSFYLASSTFQGRIRIHLLLLYSFCRVADDLVDNAESMKESCLWINKLRNYLKAAYGDTKFKIPKTEFVQQNFPLETQSALLQLPTDIISRQPLEDLLNGFEMDLGFANQKGGPVIKDESDLELYGRRVAGTVAQMCIELIFHNYGSSLPLENQRRILEAGDRMGIALQYVNIARDIAVDARMGRVYLPRSWLSEGLLTFNSVLLYPQGTKIEKLRSRLLDRAFATYEGARAAIEQLPVEARGPIRVAVESYMEIGRVWRQNGYVFREGRATVPKLRRLRVAWRALNHAS